MRHSLLLPLLPLLALASLPAAAEEPVLIELFTSQGCISCPPADDLLGELGARPGVIALSLHVDYWNRLGWKDPYSSSEATARQLRYVRQLKAPSAYTPMLVVGGEAHCVGSQAEEVAALLAAAGAAPRAGRIQILPRAAAAAGKLAFDLEVMLAAATEKKLDLYLAIAEPSRETDVGKGENVGRKLANHHVVRHLDKVAAIPKTAGTSRHPVEIKIDESWKSQGLEAVAFLQDPKTLRIEGAARLALP